MKREKPDIRKLKPNSLGFRSGVSIYKEKFSDKEITFKPKFSITKKLTFASHGKTANTLAKAFKKFKPLKFWKIYLAYVRYEAHFKDNEACASSS